MFDGDVLMVIDTPCPLQCNAVPAPVTLVIASQQDAAFAFVSLAIVLCCFLSSGSAPADEERYRELVKENEELQKIITQVTKRS
ncbi:gamma-aminobutyric acid type B receptor subunit 1-like [Leptidea sinapis]|uniref:gamma-aminobutyric acid type B receptor subunit 1-like n=1 Tax=Leptidea sinapis TaxID=189913 RepID=UPI0021C32AA8|nr:gamma-aminobutyric acid type B receptor subunit 1-like [Leptidea sinapis]